MTFFPRELTHALNLKMTNSIYSSFFLITMRKVRELFLFIRELKNLISPLLTAIMTNIIWIKNIPSNTLLLHAIF